MSYLFFLDETLFNTRFPFNAEYTTATVKIKVQSNTIRRLNRLGFPLSTKDSKHIVPLISANFIQALAPNLKNVYNGYSHRCYPA